jgi:hypothetical protein
MLMIFLPVPADFVYSAPTPLLPLSFNFFLPACTKIMPLDKISALLLWFYVGFIKRGPSVKFLIAWIFIYTTKFLLVCDFEVKINI